MQQQRKIQKIQQQVKYIKKVTKEMTRNQSKDRIARIPFHQLEQPIHNQPYLCSSKQFIACDNLQKNRTFSHKKLNLASTPPSPINQSYCKKIPLQTFQPNKFYKQIFKSGNVNSEEKKNCQSNGKISLKYGIEQKEFVSEIGNSNRSDSIINGEVIKSQYKNMHNIQNELKIKNELNKLINTKLESLMREINNQQNLINELKYKLDILQNELKNKNHIINNLILQKNAFKSTPAASSQEQIINRRLTDVQKIIQTINAQSNKTQTLINKQLETLTKQLVQLTISNNSTSMIRNCLDGSVLKINSWLTVQQAKIASLQAKISDQTFNKILQIFNTLKILNAKVTKFEEQATRKQTKKNQYSDFFQDFKLNNEQNQLQNPSIFGNDDYFFHPGNSNLNGKMKSFSQCSNYTAATTLASLLSTPSQSNIFINVDKIINHLKLNHEHQLPLKCSIDRHNRIMIKKTNKLLQNQVTKQYFKVTDQQVKILQSHHYINVLK